MATSNFLEYNLPKDAYVTFDAVTLKDYIIERLNQNEKFTDQNYEGSNLAAVIDIIAYSYHVLLFYLNQTASEVSFDQATLYENMNKIVNLLGYKPTGKQTSLVPVNAVANASLPLGNYTIKRNSFFNIDGIQYTVIKDYSFDKITAGTETIESLNENMILYQGTTYEYPSYTASGEEFEVLPIVDVNIVDNTDTRFIADNTISVYVKEKDSDTYYEYSEVDSLYLFNPTARVYERRLNESGIFEIKFGNGVFGRKLVEGDIVAVYYLKSDNQKGIISKNTLNGNKLFNYNTLRFNEIFSDVFTLEGQTTFVDVTNNSLITFNNPTNSSTVTTNETVEQIRENAPRVISSQLRLVSSQDYQTFIEKSIPGLVTSIRVVDNSTYINDYIQYFYDICVDPNKSNRVLINQVNFADSCDFNDVNIFCVPRFSILQDNTYPDFLSTSFKNLIVDLTRDRKIIGSEVVPRDPVYMAYTLGFSNNTPSLSVKDDTKLIVVREANNKINKDILRTRVKNLIVSFFDPANNTLGQEINVSDLTSSILSLEGIRQVRTTNTRESISFTGISFISWNPLYPESDISFVNQTTRLPFFKYPYLYNPFSISNLIEVIDE